MPRRAFLVTAAAVVSFAPSWRLQEPRASPELIGDEFRLFAELEVRREFLRHTEREIELEELSEALHLFEQRALALPNQLGAEFGEREQRNQAARARLAEGGALAMLAELARGGGPLPEFVATREALESLIGGASSASATSARTSSEVLTALAPGARIALDGGLYEFGNLLAREGGFPPDVSIAGRGRDATLIALDEPLAASGPLERFQLARCTVLVRTSQLFRQEPPATVTLEDVRVIGFDHGIDRGALLEFRGGAALNVRSCAFLGGYGSLPGAAQVLEAPNTALIARFEACEFDLVSVGLAQLERGVTLSFVDCTMSRILDSPKRAVESWRGVSFEGGALQRIPASARPREPRQPAELFPQLREALAK